MEIYILQIVLIILYALIFLNKKSKKNKKCKIAFFILTYITMAGLMALRRYTVGYDTNQYVIAFKRVSTLSIEELNTLRYEIGFSFLLYILNFFTNNYQILIIVSSLFVNFAVLMFIYKNSDKPLVSILIYILINYYFFYTSAMRQAIAIGIILLGFESLKKEKYFKFLLFVFTACFFHLSSILGLLFIPMRKITYKEKHLYLFIVVLIVSFIFGKNIYGIMMNFSSKLYNYGYSKFAEENYGAALLKFLVFFALYIIPLLFVIRKDKSFLNNKKDPLNTYIGLLSMGTVFMLMTTKVGIFDRFSPFFTIFITTWFPNILSKLNKRTCNVITFFTLLLLMCYWLVINLYRPEWLKMTPYQFYWEV